MRAFVAIAAVVATSCGDHKLPHEGPDGGQDAPIEDAHVDAASDAAPLRDAAIDAAPDAGIDAGGPGVITANPVDMGTVLALTSNTRTIALTNPSATTVSITGMQITGHGYSVTGTTCGATLGPLAICSVSIALLGSHIGLQNGTVSIDNAGGITAIPLSGTVVSRVEVMPWGLGNGRVVSSVPGIDCTLFGGVCDTSMPPMILAAIPPPGSRFAGWMYPGCDTQATCAVTPDAEGGLVTAAFAGPTESILHVQMAGNAPGSASVTVTDPMGGRLGTYGCYLTCSIPIVAGNTVSIIASSLGTYQGMSGACTTTDHTCTFLMPGDTNLAINSTRDVHEDAVFELPFHPVGSVAFDSAGNIVLTTTRTLRKLDPTGHTIWAIALINNIAPGGGGAAVVSPDDHIVLADSDGNLRRLTPDGDLEWKISAPVGTLAIGPDEGIATLGGDLARYTVTGALLWNDLIANLYPGLAVDGANITNVASATPVSGTNEIRLRRFDPFGNELAPTVVVSRMPSPQGFSFALDNAGLPLATEAIMHSNVTTFVVTLRRFRADGTVRFSNVEIYNVVSSPPGSALAVGSDDGIWWASGPWKLRHLDANGANEWILERPGFSATTIFGPAYYSCGIGDLAVARSNGMLATGETCLLPGDSDEAHGSVHIFHP
jgi:outer membrane protein assembly factor BamB